MTKLMFPLFVDFVIVSVVLVIGGSNIFALSAHARYLPVLHS